MGERLIPSTSGGGGNDTHIEEVSAAWSGAAQVFTCDVAE